LRFILRIKITTQKSQITNHESRTTDPGIKQLKSTMSDIAIKFENISKQYRLGTIGTGTLSHDLKRWWTVKVRGKEDPYLKIGQENVLSSHRSPLKSHLSNLSSHRSPLTSHISNLTSHLSDDYIWALKDINLEVKQGEVLGIIGKNGAGKSTLLKLLSRVTTPTTGLIKAKGRIASLLEVGTGFHPEMTGRENIFMNGSIMGMTKVEIRRKFDEIVDFAGVERYIDTPVKRYSSGMTVRLGFAIAAHLEPEILVVDEVLAVGDAEFQKKAIGKMQDVSQKRGRTVLFVSHNMGAIRDLCNNAILLSKGLIYEIGPVNEIINLYMESTRKIELIREWKNVENAPGNNFIKIRKLHPVNKEMGIIQFSLTTETIGIFIEYEVLQDIPFFTHGINFYNSTGIHIFSSHDNNKYLINNVIAKGIYNTIVWIPGNLFQDGDYLISIACMRYNPFSVLFEEKDILRIQIIDTIKQSAKPEECERALPGIIRPKLYWEERKKI
jgi:lipopolysaccharide transport system ATP-binding protein